VRGPTNGARRKNPEEDGSELMRSDWGPFARGTAFVNTNPVMGGGRQKKRLAMSTVLHLDMRCRQVSEEVGLEYLGETEDGSIERPRATA